MTTCSVCDCPSITYDCELCFAWYADYPYALDTFLTRINTELVYQLAEVHIFLTTLVVMMLKTEEVLAFHQEYALIYELKQAGIIPEA